MESQRQHSLVVLDGPQKGATYPLQGMNCSLGRSADNTVVLDSSRVSRHHAQIRLLPTGTVIEDMGSTNGTWLNGVRLAEPRTLSPGDQIRVADYVTLEYVVEDIGRAATVVSDMPGGMTQMMDHAPHYEPPTPPPPPVQREPVSYESPVEVQPSSAPVSGADYVVEAGAAVGESSSPSKRSGWLYAVIGVLVVLVCLCVALAVYLWFAPVSFWERVFDLVGVPMPTGVLVSGATWWFGF